MSERTHFQGRGTVSPAEQDRTLFETVRDAIGSTAAYVAHDVMGDIHAKLIDEAWFGRSPSPTRSQETAAPADFWRGTHTVTIEGELTRSPEQAQSSDCTHER